MKYAVLTVKHTEGYPLWDSAHTTHDITAFKNFKDGKGDIVREFVDAFRKRGIKVGFYYCAPGDFDNRFGNTLPEGKPSLHGMPPEAAGRFPRVHQEAVHRTAHQLRPGRSDLVRPIQRQVQPRPMV